MLVNEPKLVMYFWFKNPEPGIYIIDSPTVYLDRLVWNDYPILSNEIWNYGVCDDYQQLLSKCPEIVESDRQFLITLFEVNREDQPEDGGWRWHKWGDYIGTQQPTCEYLYDEPEIDRVYCYQVYEKVKN